jgi:6,7-dimethyl-8-ribityllumazine synthase
VPTIFEGDKSAARGPFAIVVSRYNESITSKLLSGAVETLASHGIEDGAIDVVWVPGAWEIPVTVSRLIASGRYAAILCLGAVIRGETTHDRYINHQISTTLGQLAIQSRTPVLFGVLTCNSLEQAIHRSGGKLGNKGAECAEAALEMAGLFSQLP